jgi:hypothetical protein
VNNKYRIHPWLRMTIGTHQNEPALLDIAAADGPRTPPHSFDKDVLFLSPAIRNLYVHGADVTADTSVINRSIRPPSIQWRKPAPWGEHRLVTNGCPPDGPWIVPAPSPGSDHDVGSRSP